MAQNDPWSVVDTKPVTAAAPSDPWAVVSHTETPAPKSEAMTRLQRFGSGVLDPLMGAGQLLAHIFPDLASAETKSLPPDLQKKLGRSPDENIAATADRAITEREAAIRAGSPSGTDWYRLAGQIASPINYLAGPLVGKAGPVAQAVGMGALSGATQPVVGGDFGKQKAEQTAVGAGTGLATGLIAKALGKVIAPKVSGDVQTMLDAGVQLTPGQMAGGTVRRAEEAGKSVPITGSAIRRAEGRAIDTFNLATANRALEPIGVQLPPGTAGRDIIQRGQSALSQAYNQVVPNLHFHLDPTFANDLSAVRQSFDHMPQQQLDQFATIQKRFADRLQASSKSPVGELTGDELQAQLSELKVLAKRYGASAMAGERDLGEAIGQVEDAIHNAVMRQNPQYAQRLSEIDKAYAMFVRVEGAAARRGTSDGRFTPGDLLGAIKSSDASTRKRAFAAGDALLQDWAQTGQNVIANRLPDSGTPERLLWDLGGGGLAASLNPKLLAAILGGAAPYTQLGGQIVRSVAQPGPRRMATAGAVEAITPYLAPAATDATEKAVEP